MLPCGTFSQNFGEDRAIVRTRLQWGILIAAIMVLLISPLFLNSYVISVINQISVYIIVALGLQLVMGYCGQISFGQAAFMAVGAYTTAILAADPGLPFWILVPISGLAAGLVGIVGGLPSLRIKGFYLAMSTLAIHYIIMWLVVHLEITGTVSGLSVPPPSVGWGIVLDDDKSMFYLIVPVMMLATFVALNLTRTKVGRAFVAIRDNDLAAEIVGVNGFYYKIAAFFISCFFAGVGGSLLAYWSHAAVPEQFTVMMAVIFVGIIIVGGLGTIVGVFFGTIFIVLLDQAMLLLAPMITAIMPALGMASSASLSVSLFGIVIILFLLLEPRGLAHRWQIFKTSYRLFPFAYWQ